MAGERDESPTPPMAQFSIPAPLVGVASRAIWGRPVIERDFRRDRPPVPPVRLADLEIVGEITMEVSSLPPWGRIALPMDGIVLNVNMTLPPFDADPGVIKNTLALECSLPALHRLRAEIDAEIQRLTEHDE